MLEFAIEDSLAFTALLPLQSSDACLLYLVFLDPALYYGFFVSVIWFQIQNCKLLGVLVCAFSGFTNLWNHKTGKDLEKYYPASSFCKPLNSTVCIVDIQLTIAKWNNMSSGVTGVN